MTPALFILGWALVAFCDAREEAALTWPFRTLNDQQFDPEVKRRLSKAFHRWGAAGVCVAAALTAWLAAKQWPGIAAYAVLGLAVYELVFNAGYAKGIGQRWHYLGNTADTDVWWRRRFGAAAGLYRAGFGLALIAGVATAVIFFEL